jgi:integrase/recombinase XerD
MNRRMKSFFSWANGRRFVVTDLMSAVPRPRFQEKQVEPFTSEEIEPILQAFRYSAVAKTNGRRPFRMQRPTYRYDEVNVRHGKEGEAKGDKGRTVYMGKSTRRTLWRYLTDWDFGRLHHSMI